MLVSKIYARTTGALGIPRLAGCVDRKVRRPSAKLYKAAVSPLSLTTFLRDFYAQGSV